MRAKLKSVPNHINSGTTTFWRNFPVNHKVQFWSARCLGFSKSDPIKPKDLTRASMKNQAEILPCVCIIQSGGNGLIGAVALCSWHMDPAQQGAANGVFMNFDGATL